MVPQSLQAYISLTATGDIEVLAPSTSSATSFEVIISLTDYPTVRFIKVIPISVFDQCGTTEIAEVVLSHDVIDMVRGDAPIEFSLTFTDSVSAL